MDSREGRDLHESRSGLNHTRWNILSLLLFFVVGLINWYAGWSGWPHLRMSTNRLRALAGLAILSVPWLLFVLIMKSNPFKKAWPRFILLTILVPIMLATIPVAILEWSFWTSDDPIRSVEMEGYRVRLYQLDCGVLCDFAIGVDQERVLAPFVLLSRRLYVFDEAIDATVEVLGKNELRVTTLPYTDQKPNIQAQVFHLKPYFFF